MNVGDSNDINNDTDTDINNGSDGDRDNDNDSVDKFSFLNSSIHFKITIFYYFIVCSLSFLVYHRIFSSVVFIHSQQLPLSSYLHLLSLS